MTRVAYKLVRRRKDGSLGSLFIDAKEKLPMRTWLQAKSVPTRGFAFRFGWHACSKKSAPHLSKHGRVWVRVLLQGVTPHERPKHQGGLWYTAQWMRIEEVVS